MIDDVPAVATTVVVPTPGVDVDGVRHFHSIPGFLPRFLFCVVVASCSKTQPLDRITAVFFW